METPSTWPTQMAAIAASCSPTRKAPLVREPVLLRAAAHPSGGVGNYANTNLGGFVGLSIDFDTEALYWISSGNSTINRCKLDGSGLEVLEGAKGKLTKATALAIMGGGPKK